MNTPSNAARAWRAYREAAASEDRFIEEQLPLVRSIVERMRASLPATVEIEDLHSAGITGLMTAARRFDPKQGTPFGAFAIQHIRGAVMDELRRMDVLSRGSRKKARELRDVIAAVEQRTGRPADESGICEELGITAQDYAGLLDEVRPTTFVALDGAIGEDTDDETSLHDLLADDSQPTIHDTLEKKDLIAIIAERLKSLPEMPKKVLAMYYFEELRIAEIAAAFGVTEGRISQIHTQAVLSLRAFLRTRLEPVVPCS